MATSGYTDVYVTKYDTLRFNWWQNTQSVAENYTNIGWSLQLISGSNGYIGSSASKSWSVNINGTPYSGTNTVGIANNTTKTLASGTTNIWHNADGSKSFAYSFSQQFNINFNGWVGTVSGSGTGVLENIPRTSTMSVTNAYIGNNITISITRAADSFTHTLRYSFGNLTGTIKDKTPDTSVSWPIPDDFYTQIPNAPAGVGGIWCDTYSGSTLIGTTGPYYFTASADESVCKPTLSPTVVDQGTASTILTGNANKIIKYYNTCNVKFNAAARKSATITSMRVTCGSKSRDGDGSLENVDDGKFIFTVTDSRGFSNKKEITKDTIDYIPLTCYFTASPEIVDGTNAKIDLTIKGKYFNGSFGAADNSLGVYYRYKINNGSYSGWEHISSTKANNEYTANVTISDLDYNNTYTVQAQAIDKINSNGVTATEQVIKIVPVFDWSKDDFNFNVPVHSKGGFTYDIPVVSYNVDEMLISGMYYLDTAATNRPIDKNGWLEVKAYDSGNYCYQKFVVYSGEKYERWRNDGIWGDWFNHNQNILWSGMYHMNATHNAWFADYIHKQKTGIQLVFCTYESDAATDQFITHTVTKEMVSLFPSGLKMQFPLHLCNYWLVGGKELFIYDDRIVGSSYNIASGTTNGVTYNNTNWVLRYVIGF